MPKEATGLRFWEKSVVYLNPDLAKLAFSNFVIYRLLQEKKYILTKWKMSQKSVRRYQPSEMVMSKKKKIILLLSIYKKNVIINHQELKSQVISTSEGL